MTYAEFEANTLATQKASFFIGAIQYEIKFTNNKYDEWSVVHWVQEPPLVQLFDSLEQLLERATINGKTLEELCPVMEEQKGRIMTYEEFEKNVLMGDEPSFYIGGIQYEISYVDDGENSEWALGHYVSMPPLFQFFSSPEELLEKATIQGKTLKELWVLIRKYFKGEG